MICRGRIAGWAVCFGLSLALFGCSGGGGGGGGDTPPSGGGSPAPAASPPADDGGGTPAAGGGGGAPAAGGGGGTPAAGGGGGTPAAGGGGSSGGAVACVAGSGVSGQQAYVKASNTGAGDIFGGSVGLSSDGNTLAIGASGESSVAAGINGDQADNTRVAAGAVYVLSCSGGTWTQQAYVKASNPDAGDGFGVSVALSADGNTLAVGSPGESSAAMGVNGNQADNTAPTSGAVYVFVRSGTTWSQQGYIKASNTGQQDQFGASLALSADGNTLAVGARLEDSVAMGVDGIQTDNTLPDSGAAYVYVRNGTTWTQQAYIKASNTGQNDMFGNAIALSADGDTLAVAATGEASATTGIGGDQTDNSALGAGAVYVFVRSSVTWSQQAYVKASNTGANDQFGFQIALSGDGNTLAAGAINEDSVATGVDGDQSSEAATDAGAVYVFVRGAGTWSQQAYVKASNNGAVPSGSGDSFGFAVALNQDGNVLVVGAPNESSAATGINGNQAQSSAFFSGAAYLFARSGSIWTQQAYIKASNTQAGDLFGSLIAVDAIGSSLAISATRERSDALGINGNQADNSAFSAGAVYVFQ